MSTEERFDGEVHGLLATAFDDGVPVLNLVPGAVEGYQRHRRRTRMLGSAGGALALAGLAVAGTVLGVGSGGPAPGAATTPSPVSSVSSVPADIAARCSGSYQHLTGYDAIGVYSSDQRGLTEVCEQELITLQQLTGDSGLVPLGLSYTRSATATEPTALTTPQIGAPNSTLQPGEYLGSLRGKPYHLSIRVLDKVQDLAGNCMAKACPPNLKLADGHPATKVTAVLRDSYLEIHYDAKHTVVVRAGLEDRNSDNPLPPFDFDKLVTSPAFARLIGFDIHTLDQLTHPS